jgi:hypothetical protein
VVRNGPGSYSLQGYGTSRVEHTDTATMVLFITAIRELFEKCELNFLTT